MKYVIRVFNKLNQSLFDFVPRDLITHFWWKSRSWRQSILSQIKTEKWKSKIQFFLTLILWAEFGTPFEQCMKACAAHPNCIIKTIKWSQDEFRNCYLSISYTNRSFPTIFYVDFVFINDENTSILLAKMIIQRLPSWLLPVWELNVSSIKYNSYKFYIFAGLSKEDVDKLRIPNARPFVHKLDENLKPISSLKYLSMDN